MMNLFPFLFIFTTFLCVLRLQRVIRYDEAQARFTCMKDSRIEDNFYARQDGTLAYYVCVVPKD